MWKHWREGGLRVYLQHFCIVQKRDENLRRGKMSLFWVYLLLFVAWVSICPTEGSEGNIFWLVLSAQLYSDADGSNVIKINNDWVFLKARPSLSSTEKRWSVTSLKIQLTGNNKLTVTIMCRHSLMWSMDRPFAFCKYEPLTKAVCVCVGVDVSVWTCVQHACIFPLLRADQYMSWLVGQCPPVTWLQ